MRIKFPHIENLKMESSSLGMLLHVNLIILVITIIAKQWRVT